MVENCWFEYNIFSLEDPVGKVRQLLLFAYKSLQFIFAIQPKPVYILVDISAVQPIQYSLRFCELWISAALDPLYDGISVVSVNAWIAQIVQKVEVTICRDQGVPHHQIYGLSNLVIVDGSEHFESEVIHHFDCVDILDRVRQLVVDDSR